MNFGDRSIVAKAITLRFVVVLGRLDLELPWIFFADQVCWWSFGFLLLQWWWSATMDHKNGHWSIYRVFSIVESPNPFRIFVSFRSRRKLWILYCNNHMDLLQRIQIRLLCQTGRQAVYWVLSWPHPIHHRALAIRSGLHPTTPAQPTHSGSLWRDIISVVGSDRTNGRSLSRGVLTFYAGAHSWDPSVVIYNVDYGQWMVDRYLKVNPTVPTWFFQAAFFPPPRTHHAPPPRTGLERFLSGSTQPHHPGLGTVCPAAGSLFPAAAHPATTPGLGGWVGGGNGLIAYWFGDGGCPGSQRTTQNDDFMIFWLIVAEPYNYCSIKTETSWTYLVSKKKPRRFEA